MKYYKLWEGWGDTLYQRPVIKELCKRFPGLYIETPLPQLLSDLPINFVEPSTSLRTQKQNVQDLNATGFVWKSAPGFPPVQLCHFQSDFEAGRSPIGAFEKCARVELDACDCVMDVPENKRAEKSARGLAKGWGKFAIVKPCTERDEWRNPSRNCTQESIEAAVETVRDNGFRVVWIASVGRGESLSYPLFLEKGDVVMLKGEVDMFTVIELSKMAKVVIAPVGNALPIGLATGAKTFIIGGGYQDTEQLFDLRFDRRLVRLVSPDNPCNCFNHNHECRKYIDVKRVKRELQALIDVG